MSSNIDVIDTGPKATKPPVPMDEWKTIPWPKLERRVYKLQKRIYRAASRGDVRTVRRLQRLMMKSWSAKCLAVRRVSQDNQGKKTAGVDGVKSLTPAQRIQLVNDLKLESKGKPARRVWIPKPGRDEKRPLGIPVMYDRALQGLLKLALEPSWEARFEENSYGFRPGRGCHDAREAIFNSIRYKPKWVLDADIAKCFDKINHQALLDKLNTSPTIRRQIRAWLKAGVVDNGEFLDTFEGTPQGGVISPLLANIALHGLEDYVLGTMRRNMSERRALTVVRYADDFVVMHKDKEVVERAQELINEWLSDMGLQLKPEKTSIAHTLEGDAPGFDFLGFNVRQYKVGKYRTGKNTKGKPLYFKTLIKPSKKSVAKHVQRLKEVVAKHKGVSSAALIAHLNPIIRGWANYFRTSVSSEIFSAIDKYLWQILYKWAKGRHPNKSGKWCAKKYWTTDREVQWNFTGKTDTGKVVELLKHSNTEIVRHVKVKGKASPYDGNLTYWSTRLGKNPEIPTLVAKLLKEQKGKCEHCGLTFKDGDKWEVDHILPKSMGGKDKFTNLQLLHKHCHDEKTARDGSLCTKRAETVPRGNRVKPGSSIHDKDDIIEEPDEAKVSRPVLKTSRGGDSLA